MLIRNIKRNTTYQPEKEKVCGVGTKYLRHSMDIRKIKEKVTTLRHKVGNILIRSRENPGAIESVFVDLQPAENNKQNNKIIAIQN